MRFDTKGEKECAHVIKVPLAAKILDGLIATEKDGP